MVPQVSLVLVLVSPDLATVPVLLTVPVLRGLLLVLVLLASGLLVIQT
jgi:hypothetical protein